MAARSVFYVEGKHRSAALAEVHLSSLEREFRNYDVRITSRRDAPGRESAHGQFFRFSVRSRKPSKKRKRKLTEKLAFLLHWEYSGKSGSHKKGGSASLRVDFVVGGNSKLLKADPVERFQALIKVVVSEIIEKHRWLARLAQSSQESEKSVVDSSVAPGEKPPKRARVRSAYRGNKLFYGSREENE